MEYMGEFKVSICLLRIDNCLLGEFNVLLYCVR